MEKRKLTKSKDANLWGICAGIAEYFNIDPSIVRVGTVILSLCSGIGIIAYIAANFIIPDAE